jgi:hypothetical protein
MRGEGSVYERKDGYWVAQYKGRYRYAKTKKEAKRKLLELLKEGEVHKPHGTTVAAFMDRWIEFAQQDLKPATIKRYREAVEIYVKPSLARDRGAILLQPSQMARNSQAILGPLVRHPGYVPG